MTPKEASSLKTEPTVIDREAATLFTPRGVPPAVVQQIDWMDRALKAEAKLANLRMLLKSFEGPHTDAELFDKETA